MQSRVAGACRKIPLALTCAAIFVAIVASAASNAIADPAQDCQQDKDLNLTVHGCTELLNESPPLPDIALLATRLYRAAAYEGLGQFDAAITDLTESIRIKATAIAYVMRGTAYQEKRNYDLALADYDAALRLKPDYFDAYESRGSLHLAAGELEAAIADYGFLIQNKPDDANGYFMRARAEEILKQNNAAITDLNHFIDIDANRKATGLFFRALANEDKGLSELASSDFTHAIALKPALAMERRWAEYLKSIQADGDYSNWLGKPYDIYLTGEPPLEKGVPPGASAQDVTDRPTDLTYTAEKATDTDLAFEASQPILRFAVSHMHGRMGWTFSSCSGYLYVSKDTIRYEVIGPEKFKDHSFSYERSEIANVSDNGVGWGKRSLTIRLQNGTTYTFLHVTRDLAEKGAGGTGPTFWQCRTVDIMKLALENFAAAVDRVQSNLKGTP